MKAVIPIVIGVAFLASTTQLHSQDGPVIAGILELPEPSTLADLRVIHRRPPSRGVPARDTEGLPCALPEVSVLKLTTVVKDPTNSLEIVLPGEWKEIGRDAIGDEFRKPYTRYENAANWRFTVYRVASGAVGPTWDASPDGARLETEDCEVSRGTSGVIWAFRTVDRNGVPRYTGNGDAVSAHGRRYKFSVGAPTRAERDSLAAFLSLAVNAGYRTASVDDRQDGEWRFMLARR